MSGQTTRYEVRWIPRHGGWEYPGCSREEATFSTREDAEAAIRSLIEGDQDWAEARLYVQEV